MRRQGFEPDGTEKWFVLMGDEQCGPFNAAEMAQRLDSGAIDWTTAVWRDGFRDWRAARRDAVLVTSIAGERGFASDTVRLNSARSFVAGEDTVTDRSPLPPMHDSGRIPGVAASGQEDAGAFEVPDPRVQVGSRSSRPPPVTVLRWGHVSLRLPHSLVSVAAVSFAAGVLSAALWARFVAPVAGSVTEIEPTPAGGAARELVSAAGNLPREPTAASGRSTSEPASDRPRLEGAKDDSGRATSLEPTVPSRELPKSQEIRAGLRSVAHGVRGCLADAKTGADVLIYLDGPSGRVRDVHIRRPKLPRERVRCLVNAIRQLQLQPFRHDELVYPYKFAW